MKEKYLKPQFDVQELNTLDIITVSGDPTTGKDPGDDNPVDWGT